MKFLKDGWYIFISNKITFQLNNCCSGTLNTTGYLLKMSTYLTFYHTILLRERPLAANVSCIRIKISMCYDQNNITFLIKLF